MGRYQNEKIPDSNVWLTLFANGVARVIADSNGELGFEDEDDSYPQIEVPSDPAEVELLLAKYVFQRGSLETQRAQLLANVGALGAVSAARAQYEIAFAEMQLAIQPTSDSSDEQRNLTEVRFREANKNVILAMLEVGYTDDFEKSLDLQTEAAGKAKYIENVLASIDVHINALIANTAPWAYKLFPPSFSIDYKALELLLRYRLMFGIKDPQYAFGNEPIDDKPFAHPVLEELLEEGKTAAALVGPLAMADYLDVSAVQPGEAQKMIDDNADTAVLDRHLDALLTERGILFGNAVVFDDGVGVPTPIEMARYSYLAVLRSDPTAAGYADRIRQAQVTVVDALVADKEPTDVSLKNADLVRSRFRLARFDQVEKEIENLSLALDWADQARRTSTGTLDSVDFDSLELALHIRQLCDISDSDYALGHTVPTLAQDRFYAAAQKLAAREIEWHQLNNLTTPFSYFAPELAYEELGIEPGSDVTSLSDATLKLLPALAITMQSGESLQELRAWQLNHDRLSELVKEYETNSASLWRRLGAVPRAVDIAMVGGATAIGIKFGMGTEWLTSGGIVSSPTVLAGLFALSRDLDVRHINRRLDKQPLELLRNNVELSKARGLAGPEFSIPNSGDRSIVLVGGRPYVFGLKRSKHSRRWRSIHKRINSRLTRIRLEKARDSLLQHDASRPKFVSSISPLQQLMVFGVGREVLHNLAVAVREAPWTQRIINERDLKLNTDLSVEDIALRVKAISQVGHMRAQWLDNGGERPFMLAEWTESPRPLEALVEPDPDVVPLPVSAEVLAAPEFSQQLMALSGTMLAISRTADPLRALLGEARKKQLGTLAATTDAGLSLQLESLSPPSLTQ